MSADAVVKPNDREKKKKEKKGHFLTEVSICVTAHVSEKAAAAQ